MNSADFNKSMETIVEALKEQGYDPYAQLFGFLQNGDPVYITRSMGARDLIQQLDKEEIRQFIRRIK